MGGRDSGRHRRSTQHDRPPIDDQYGASLDLEDRSLNFLDKLIEHHGNDNPTGMRADIPPKIARQLERRR